MSELKISNIKLSNINVNCFELTLYTNNGDVIKTLIPEFSELSTLMLECIKEEDTVHTEQITHPEIESDSTKNNFKFSKSSLLKLSLVDICLANIMQEALKISNLDFSIIEGKRNKLKQQEYYDSGASNTLDSYHLTGHAVDIAPFINGKKRWDWPLFFILAEFVQQVAINLDIQVVWGGCWEDLRTCGDLYEAQARYIDRKSKQGKKPLLDGPHFQVSRR